MHADGFHAAVKNYLDFAEGGNMSQLEDIVKRGVDKAAEEAIINCIKGGDYWGRSQAPEIRDAIKAAASEMIEDDPEIQKMLRDALVGWIRVNSNTEGKE